MAAVALIGVHKVFPRPDGSPLAAVQNLDLAVAAGELLVLLGPSGCGKTTVLRLIAGFEEPTRGSIHLDGAPAAGRPPHARDVAMVFQTGGLYPHLSVRENLALPLQVRKLPAREIGQRVDAAVDLLALGPIVDHRPGALSGGEQQRVALGRALVRRPKLFLLDEPLSQLDAPLRQQLREEIRRLQRQLGTAMIYVTHDQQEALTLGDRIAVMAAGELCQAGVPQDLYDAPATRFVAEFIGSPPINLLPVTVTARDSTLVLVSVPGEGSSAAAPFELPLPADRTASLSKWISRPLLLGLRPEHLRVSADGEIGAVVESVRSAGPDAWLGLRVAREPVTVRIAPEDKVAAGSPVRLKVATHRMTLFDPQSGTRVG